MRIVSKRKMKIAGPALAAAAMAAFGGIPAAHADFTVSVGSPIVFGGDTEYVLSALNTGTNGTGSTLTAEDVTVSTPGTGTSGALLIDVADINGDGNADADVDGSPITAGEYSADPDSTSNIPFFGAKSATHGFTLIGIAGTNVTPTSAISSPAVDVYVNGQTAVNSGGLSGTPAVYLTSATVTSIDPAFTSGTVHSLEVASKAPSGGAPVASSTAIPFANIVVPTGTIWTAIGSVGGETGAQFNFSISNGATTATGAVLTLTSLEGAGTNVGVLTVTGSNGSYVPQRLNGSPATAITGVAATTGNVQVLGFTPSTDAEVFALAVDSSGTLASGSTLTAALADLSAAVAGEGGTVQALTSAATPDISGIFNPAAWNVEVTFPTGVPAGDPYLNWDFSSDTVDPGLTITDVGVVPEPTGLSVLVLGGMGLLARRRRMSKLA